MSKKVKCIECENSMRWACPEKVTKNNLQYAKHCLDYMEVTLVCGYTMKTKGIQHEQYCKHFKKNKNLEIDMKYEQQRIEELKKMILECEEEVKND